MKYLLPTYTYENNKNENTSAACNLHFTLHRFNNISYVTYIKEIPQETKSSNSQTTF